MNPTRPIRIRTLQQEDAAAVARLAVELGYPASEAVITPRIQRLLQHPDHSAFIATENHQPIGWLHLFINYPLESEPCAEIAGLVVTESHRGRGVGRQLLGAARQWAAERELQSLRVRCQIRRSRAHHFYQANGFTELKTQKVFTLPLTRRR